MSAPVAVLGAGPAGAMAAERLARAGRPVVLLDEKMAWEKPCGGGVTFKAYSQYPFLAESTASRRVETTWLRADAAPVQLRLEKPLLIFSRRELNQLLLDRAAEAGAELWKERVLRTMRTASGWQVSTASGTFEASSLIVATGARNPLREMGTAWKPKDTMIALGYHVPWLCREAEIKFFPDLEGYIWLFPRFAHVSAGICGKGESAALLRQRLEQFLAGRGIGLEGAEFYAHVLPALAAESWPDNRLAGDGWMAVGDAAGLVDPVTGEGIYYAMRSGELAGELLASGRESTYSSRISQEFASDLAYASTLARRVYCGRFLGGANTTRMLQLVRHSTHVHGVMQELFAGTLPYLELRRRLRGNPIINTLLCLQPVLKPS